MAYKLSLPRSITVNNTGKEDDDDDYSFTRDLLYQFDKRRSRLHYELGFSSKVKLIASFRGIEKVSLNDRSPHQNPLQ